MKNLFFVIFCFLFLATSAFAGDNAGIFVDKEQQKKFERVKESLLLNLIEVTPLFVNNSRYGATVLSVSYCKKDKTKWEALISIGDASIPNSVDGKQVMEKLGSHFAPKLCTPQEMAIAYPVGKQ